MADGYTDEELVAGALHRVWFDDIALKLAATVTRLRDERDAAERVAKVLAVALKAECDEHAGLRVNDDVANAVRTALAHPDRGSE